MSTSLQSTSVTPTSGGGGGGSSTASTATASSPSPPSSSSSLGGGGVDLTAVVWDLFVATDCNETLGSVTIRRTVHSYIMNGITEYCRLHFDLSPLASLVSVYTNGEVPSMLNNWSVDHQTIRQIHGAFASLRPPSVLNSIRMPNSPTSVCHSGLIVSIRQAILAITNHTPSLSSSSSSMQHAHPIFDSSHTTSISATLPSSIQPAASMPSISSSHSLTSVMSSPGDGGHRRRILCIVRLDTDMDIVSVRDDQARIINLCSLFDQLLLEHSAKYQLHPFYEVVLLRVADPNSKVDNYGHDTARTATSTITSLSGGNQVHISYSAFASDAAGTFHALQQLAHRHLDLVSIRISGIPMRRMKGNSGSGNKKVSLCFRGWEGSHLLQEREKIRVDDSRERTNPNLRIDQSSAYEARRQLALVWTKLPKHFSKHMLTSCCVHRITSSHAASNSSQALLRHVLAAKPVTLIVRTGMTVSYVLMGHGNEVYLHCLHHTLAQPHHLAIPKRMATVATVTSSMTQLVKSSVLSHSWIGSIPTTIESGYERAFPKTILESSNIPTSIRLELATRDISLTPSQSLIWDKTYPKLYALTQLCLPALKMATPMSRQQQSEMYSSFRQLAEQSLSLKHRLFDRPAKGKTAGASLSRTEAMSYFRRLWDELHVFMIRYAYESSVHVKMKELVEHTRSVLINEVLEKERQLIELGLDRKDESSTSSPAPPSSTAAASSSSSGGGGGDNLAGSGGIASEAANLEQKSSEVEAVTSAWAHLDSLSDMAESQRIRALTELTDDTDSKRSNQMDITNDDSLVVGSVEDSVPTTIDNNISSKRRKQQSSSSTGNNDESGGGASTNEEKVDALGRKIGSTFVCYNCGRGGHIARNCPNARAAGHGPPPLPAPAATTDISSSSTAAAPVTGIGDSVRKRKRASHDHKDDTFTPTPTTSSSGRSSVSDAPPVKLGSNEFVLQPSFNLLEQIIGEPLAGTHTRSGNTSNSNSNSTGGMHLASVVAAASAAAGLGTGSSGAVSLLENYWSRETRRSLSHLRSACGPREFAGRLPAFVYKW